VLVEILDQGGNNLEVISSAICEAGTTCGMEHGEIRFRQLQVPPALQ